MNGYQSDIKFPEINFQQASTTEHGITRYANTLEVDNGNADNLAISVLQFNRVIANKLTGNWDNKGFIDASTNPDYPPAKKGDVYTIATAGIIGGDSGTKVQVHDVMYCIAENGGGNETTVGEDWNIIQANVDLATTTVAGILRLATPQEATNGSLNTVVITPETLKEVLNTRILPASETQVGVARFSTLAELEEGQRKGVSICPAVMAPYIANLLTQKEGAMGNPAIDGNVLQSTAAGVRSWTPINRKLFANYNTFELAPNSRETNLGSTYTLPAGTLIGSASLQIQIGGELLNQSGKITLQVYLGNKVIFTHETDQIGSWNIQIIGGRINTNTFKGQAMLLFSGENPIVYPIDTSRSTSVSNIRIAVTDLALDTEPQEIRVTYQNPVVGVVTQIKRTNFLIQHLV